MPEYYKEICLSPTTENPTAMELIGAADAGTAPDKVRALARDFGEMGSIVATVFEDDQDARRELFLLMHRGADRGLRGMNYNILDGRSNLEEIKNEIVKRAYKVRDRRFWQYTRLALWFGILPLIVGFVIMLTRGFGLFAPVTGGNSYGPVFAWTLAVFWIPASASISVWAEFVLRASSDMSYVHLLSLDPNRWRPGQRLIITIGIAFIFGFLLSVDIIQVGIFGHLLNDFAGKTPLLSLAVGGVTGLSFMGVRAIILSVKPEVQHRTSKG